MTRLSSTLFIALLASLMLMTGRAVADDDGDDSIAHPPERTSGPMDIFLNSPDDDDDDTDLLAHCVIDPKNFPGMQHDLNLRGNRALFDPLTEKGAIYAEYYVVKGQSQVTATNVFRTSCKLNHGT